MNELKLILEVNRNGKLILPFSRRVLNLPRIKNCFQLKYLVCQQGNNMIWLHTRQYDKIRFKTTERELTEIFDQYDAEKNEKSNDCKDITVIDSDNGTVENEENGSDHIRGSVSNKCNINQNLEQIQ